MISSDPEKSSAAQSAEERETTHEPSHSLALDKIAAALQAQSVAIHKSERSIARLRHLRVGGVLTLMAIAGLLSAGGVVGLLWRFYDDTKRAQLFAQHLNAAGISTEIRTASDGIHLTVVGPLATARKLTTKDGMGNGVEIVFRPEGNK